MTGASDKSDRAGHEPSQQAVSAVPVTIPSAEWPAIEYDDGYPEDEEFTALGQLPFDFGRAARWLLSELPRASEYMPCFCEIESGADIMDKPCKLISFSTGGWSGAESIVGFIERRIDAGHFMLSWRRGGHFVFEIPARYLAQGTEARSDETEGLGPQGDGPVLEEHAPGIPDKWDTEPNYWSAIDAALSHQTRHGE